MAHQPESAPLMLFFLLFFIPFFAKVLMAHSHVVRHLQRPLHPQPHRIQPRALRPRPGPLLLCLRICCSPSPYCALLRAALFGPDTPDRLASSAGASSSAASLVGSPASGNIFRFKAEVPRNAKRVLFAGGDDQDLLFPGIFTPKGSGPRKIPRSPYKDDFYLNLVDWSSHNVLSVGLGNCVYLWNACSSKVTKLCDLGADDTVCSVSWAQRGTHLAVGTNQGTVQIWDATRCKRMRTMESHRMRIGALAWNSSLLSSGSRDKNILHHDLHGLLVCNLVWSKNVNELVSTHGYSQNQIIVWRYPTMSKLAMLTGHTFRVLYLAISPDGQTIVTGAGDETLRFWNVFPSPKSQCSDSLSSIGATSFVRSYIR
ncbi:hypothetical protein VPH35_031471 [Triticum aestivum]